MADVRHLVYFSIAIVQPVWIHYTFEMKINNPKLGYVTWFDQRGDFQNKIIEIVTVPILLRSGVFPTAPGFTLKDVLIQVLRFTPEITANKSFT